MGMVKITLNAGDTLAMWRIARGQRFRYDRSKYQAIEIKSDLPGFTVEYSDEYAPAINRKLGTLRMIPKKAIVVLE